MTLADLGQKLQERREAKGFSIEDIAEKIKISPRILTHIETGNRKGLPHTVYAKGFITSYARVLGYDLDEVQSELRHVFAGETEDEIQVHPGPLTRAGSFSVGSAKRMGVLFLLFAMLAAVIGGGWFFFDTYGADIVDLVKKPFVAASGQQEATAPFNNNTVESTPEELTITLSPQMRGQAGEATEATQAAVSAVQSALPSGPVEADPAPVAEEPIAEAQRDGHLVQLTVNSGQCWVGYETDGGSQRSETLRSGQTGEYPYTTSLRLTLGNPSVVTVLHDGEVYGRKLDGSRREILQFP